jgi:TonB family protein
MPRQPKSAAGRPQPVPSTLSEFRTKLDDGSFDTDFANLAACFGTHGGGNLTPELCAELALEIVLNDIVERACLTTGASGAAIVLRRDGEMVCRARSGDLAPELGARLEGTSGLSGECLRTRQIQSCDDVRADPRANLEASERLGARSVIVMPLLRGAGLVGVFELFSSQLSAFGEHDHRTLEGLAGRTVKNLERADEYVRQLENKRIENKQIENGQFENKRPESEHLKNRIEEQLAVSPFPEPSRDILSDSREGASRRRFDPITWALGTAVVACAILIGLLVGRHSGAEKMRIGKTSVAAASVSLQSSNREASNHESSNHAPDAGAAPGPVISGPEESASVAPSQAISNSVTGPAVPPGSLQVFENGKEVFRLPPGRGPGAAPSPGLSGTGQGSGQQPAVSAVSNSGIAHTKSSAESTLERRVEPEYPEEALRQKVEGVVVLEVHVGADGAVQAVQVVSGPPQLVKASTDAVKQWRFKPHIENGHPMQMQSRVRLNFRLPQ